MDLMGVMSGGRRGIGGGIGLGVREAGGVCHASCVHREGWGMEVPDVGPDAHAALAATPAMLRFAASGRKADLETGPGP